MQHDFACPVGFSDHTTDPSAVPALAVAMGATALEKHVTLDVTDQRNPDTQHSIGPAMFGHMVEMVRLVPAILGDGVKAPCAEEAHDRLWARRGSDGLRPTDDARQGRWE
jgi:sialic acid synthase SpsE